MAFNLGDLIKQGTVPNLGTARDEIEYIDLALIDDDPRNFYQLSGLDELAANIELLGLQQPIRVRTNPEDPTHVIIVSGHRRCSAIRNLAKEEPERWKQVPCIREQNTESPALQELRLIYANSDTRKISDADLSKQAARVEMLLYQLKEEGYDFPGRMRDHVAKACQVSKSKLSRLKVISEGLSEVWKLSWEKNKLPEQAAYALARMPDEFQRRMFKACSGSLKGNSAERIYQKYSEGWRWEATITCPSGKTCSHADAALHHDMENYNMCGGNTCCLTCEQFTRNYSPCERACSKAKSQRKEENADKKAKEEAEQAKKQRKLLASVSESASRLLVAADAAGISDNIEMRFNRYGGTYSVKELRNFAAGNFGGRIPYTNEFEPSQLYDVAEIAKALQCSADYVVGLSDELHPGSMIREPDSNDEASTSIPASVPGMVWHKSSEYPENGTVAVVVHDWEMHKDEPEFEITVGIFKNGQWLEFGREYFDIYDVHKWLPIGDPLTEEPPEQSADPDDGPGGQLVFAGWMPGGTTPCDPCDVVAVFDLGDGHRTKMFARWNGREFLFKAQGEKIDMEPIKWMALPPEED